MVNILGGWAITVTSLIGRCSPRDDRDQQDTHCAR